MSTLPTAIVPSKSQMTDLAEKAAKEPTKTQVFEMQIARFYDYIEHITNRNETEMTPEQKRQYVQEFCSFEKFRDAMYDIFGDEVKVEDIRLLYRRISANPDCEVDWSEVFGYAYQEADAVDWRAAEAKESQGDNVIDDDKVIVTKLRRQIADAAGGGSKRRDIVKQILYVSQADNFVTVSQHGLVQIMAGGKYHLITSMTVQQGDMLTTGCCYLPNLRRLAIATDRELCIWDYRSPSRESFLISPFPASLLCIAAISPDGFGQSQFTDCILFGDVEGCVGILTIHQKDLNSKSPHKKQGGISDDRSGESSGGKKDGLVHLIDLAKLATPIIRKKVHYDWTVKVVHCPDLKMFASCSPSTRTSFIAEELLSLKSEKPYTKYVTVDRGCNTFCYSDRSNIFVTGGSDKILRIWHPGIYTKPAGKLYGHIFSIVDIAVNDADQHIISLSSARLIRVWDIHTLTSLQVFGDNENRPGERRIHCMIFEHKNEVLLTGSSVVDEWPLARKYHATILVPHTHNYAIMTMAVNIPLGQLLTADTSPQIRVWDIETGKMVSQVDSAHGPNVEVVAAAFDPTGYRMVTGGMNGSLCIWDFGATQILKKYEPPEPCDEKTVINLLFFDKSPIPGVHYVIGTGWGGKIKVFRDATSEMELVELCDFSEPEYQEPDILFTSLIDNPEEARRSVASSKLEGDRVGRGSAATSILPEGYKTKKRKPKGDGEDSPQRHTSGLDLLREKSSVEEVLRFGFNRGLFLSENGRTLVTGTAFGHLVQWDLRSMAMEIRWKMPAVSAAVDMAPLEETTSKKETVTSDEENDIQVVAPPERWRSTARSDFEPTPVSHTSMVVLSNYEKHRVNAILVIKPTLPSTKKKINEEGFEVSDNEENDEDEPPAGAATPLALDDGEVAEQNKEDSPRPSGSNSKTPKSSKTPTEESDDHEEEEAELDEVFMGAATGNALYSQMTLLVSGHQDSWLRFWTFGRKNSGPNRIIHKVQMELSSHPSAVTTLCADVKSKFLAAGDYKGYVCTWTMQLSLPPTLKSKVLKHNLTSGRRHFASPGKSMISTVMDTSVPSFNIKFCVSWRAHNLKVEDIAYYQPFDILFTSSMDGSVRIWKGFTSKYLGFFGQPQPFYHTGKHFGPLSQPILPDIDDKPVYPATSEKLLERKRAARRIRDLPLIVDRTRWNSGSSAQDPAKKRYWQPKMVKDQYFNLLVKPKVQSLVQEDPNALTKPGTGSKKTGGIYRSLITYGVTNIDNVSPRAIDFGVLEDKK